MNDTPHDIPPDDQTEAPPARNGAGRTGGHPLLTGLLLAIFFAVGLLLGFLGRPWVLQDVPVEVVVTVDAADLIAVVTPTAADAAANTPEPPAAADTTGEATPTIMEFLMADVRHVQGEPDAPITIIEFSDFK